MEDFNVFHRYSANFPWRSQAIWLMGQMIRWGHIREPFSITEAVNAIYRPDIYRSVQQQLGLLAPDIDYKVEGIHAEPWVLEVDNNVVQMGSDVFFDNKTYDAKDIIKYLESFKIQHPAFDVHQLATG